MLNGTQSNVRTKVRARGHWLENNMTELESPTGKAAGHEHTWRFGFFFFFFNTAAPPSHHQLLEN